MFFESCYSYKYEQLTYYNMYSDEGKIRMDGFYICYDTVSNIGTYVKPHSMIFYPDGTGVFCRGDMRILKDVEFDLRNTSWTGPFIIDKDTIRWQTYHNTSDRIFSGTMAVSEQVFHIVNDSTLDKLIRWENKVRIYQFVKFRNKPDPDKAWFKHKRKLK